MTALATVTCVHSDGTEHDSAPGPDGMHTLPACSAAPPVEHAQVLAALAALGLDPADTGTVVISPDEVTVTTYLRDEDGRKFLVGRRIARQVVSRPVVNRP